MDRLTLSGDKLPRHDLFADLRNVRWTGGDARQGRHALAWLRYFVHREYPIKLAAVRREPG